MKRCTGLKGRGGMEGTENDELGNEFSVVESREEIWGIVELQLMGWGLGSGDEGIIIDKRILQHMEICMT